MRKSGIVRLTMMLIGCILSVNVQAQIITTFAGNGTASGISGDRGLATAASINAANGGAFDKYGNYYVVEILGHRIMKVALNGIITTVVGTGSGGYNGDGIPATSAKIDNPTALAVDTSGNIYIDDANNFRIRKVDAITGMISTIAGTGVSGYNGDNIPATTAQLGGVQDICIGKSGDIYIADQVNSRIRKINSTGTIVTIAGSGGFSAACTGDGGPATNATFNFIFGIAVDDTGNIFIADFNAAKVRKVDTFGIITTIAGNGTYTYSGDGIPATDAQINPVKLTFDRSRNLVIADKYNRRIFKIDNLGIIHSIAGNGISGYSGDSGPATAASLDFPAGVVYDACDNLYIAESTNRRVRKVTFNPITTPTVTITGVSTATVGATVTVNAAVSGAGSVYSIKWFKNSALFSTTSTPTTIYTKGAGTDTITARVVPAVTTCYDSAMSATAHLVSVGSVGVEQLSHKSATLHLHPNPAHHTLAVSCDAGLAAVSVLNILGAEVARQACAGATTIKLPVQELPQGMYVVHATATDGSKIVQRFVKE